MVKQTLKQTMRIKVLMYLRTKGWSELSDIEEGTQFIKSLLKTIFKFMLQWSDICGILSDTCQMIRDFEKLVAAQPRNKLAAFDGNQNVRKLLSPARQGKLSWAILLHSKFSHTISWRISLISYSIHLIISFTSFSPSFLIKIRTVSTDVSPWVLCVPSNLFFVVLIIIIEEYMFVLLRYFAVSLEVVILLFPYGDYVCVASCLEFCKTVYSDVPVILTWRFLYMVVLVLLCFGLISVKWQGCIRLCFWA
jgi:hypothetical protein